MSSYFLAITATVLKKRSKLIGYLQPVERAITGVADIYIYIYTYIYIYILFILFIFMKINITLLIKKFLAIKFYLIRHILHYYAS